MAEGRFICFGTRNGLIRAILAYRLGYIPNRFRIIPFSASWRQSRFPKRGATHSL